MTSFPHFFAAPTLNFYSIKIISAYCPLSIHFIFIPSLPSTPPLDLYYGTSIPFRHYVFIPPLAFYSAIKSSALAFRSVPTSHREYRVPGFLSSRLNWLSSPNPQASVDPPHVVPRGRHTRLPERGLGEPIRTKEQALWYSRYSTYNPSMGHPFSHLADYIVSHILCLSVPVQLFRLNLLHTVHFFHMRSFSRLFP